VSNARNNELVRERRIYWLSIPRLPPERIRMNRRAFSLQLAGIAGAAALAAGGLPRGVLAQGAAPVEGKDFLKLKQPVAMASTGKIEVVEFFWYACPHCFHFEPTLEPWVAKLPADVHFRRVPVGFNDVRKEFHQRLYFTLEAMNQVEALHQKVFARFHLQHRPIDREADALQFAQENGLDVAKFKEILNSFSMQTKIGQANRLTEAYEIDGVPELGLQGRFTTGPSMAGDEPKALLVADYLIDRVRKGA
jgi:thiol:disulfide interchange protein DsbA